MPSPAATAAPHSPGKGDSREDKLTGKRLAALNQYLDNTISDAPLPSGISIVRLAAAFGMNTSRTYAEPLAWESLDSGGTVPSLGYPTSPLTPEQAIWEHIRPILRTRLAYNTNKDLLSDTRQNEMQRQAMLVGFDHEGQWKRICTEEIPVPKSWGPGIDAITLQPRESKTVLHADRKAGKKTAKPAKKAAKKKAKAA